MAVNGDSMGFWQVVRTVEVGDYDISAGLGGEGNPVVEIVESHGFVEEHVLVGVVGIVVEGVDLAWDLAILVSLFTFCN